MWTTRRLVLPALALLVATALVTQLRGAANEIDYDQSSTDPAEFIELFNGGSSAANVTIDLNCPAPSRKVQCDQPQPRQPASFREVTS